MSEEGISQTEGVLIISCADLKTEQLILKILGTESLPDVTECNNIKGYPWSFETKYYSAVINLYSLKERTTLDDAFCDTIKGVVFYFDSQKHSSFKAVLRWMPYLKTINAEVQLLVCNNLTDEAKSSAPEKNKIQDWCIKNEYELVELNPTYDCDDEDEGAFKDAKGYDRVVQALQTHPWNDLKMKSKIEKQNENLKTQASNSPKCSEINEPGLNTGAVGGSVSGEKKVKKSKAKKKAAPSVLLPDDEKFLNDLANEDPGGESFEMMFAKFASMKAKAETLSGEERRKFAETVAINFWRAMGGDEDEIADLDDDLDNES